ISKCTIVGISLSPFPSSLIYSWLILFNFLVYKYAREKKYSCNIGLLPWYSIFIYRVVIVYFSQHKKIGDNFKTI
ncbi:MAG: hypothetical protein M3Y53_10300, partial [Thermoproteota archaeon]|nr:hypothetical protein [Thermoproteota archaeon]